MSEVCSSPDLVEWYMSSSESLARLPESSWMPSLMFLPNCSLNFLKSSAFSWISPKSSMHFLTMFFLITLRILFCWSVSREMLRGRSSESTTPLTKVSHSGIRSSQLSMMNTRRTYSLMWPEFFFLGSKRSKGARLGTKRIEVNSSWPSTEKCLTARCSSLVTSSGLRVQIGFCLFMRSHSCVTSLTFFFFLLLLRLLVDLLDLGLVAVLLLLLLLVLVLVVVHLLVHLSFFSASSSTSSILGS